LDFVHFIASLSTAIQAPVEAEQQIYLQTHTFLTYLVFIPVCDITVTIAPTHLLIRHRLP